MTHEELEALLNRAEEANRTGNYNEIEPLANTVLLELDKSKVNLPATLIDETASQILRAHALLLLGTNARLHSDYPKAMEYFIASQAASETANDQLGVARAINGIGNVYLSISEYASALEQYRKAITIFEAIGNEEGLAINLGNLGNVYSNLSEYSLALEHMHKALAIDEKHGRISGIANNTGNIAIVYWNLAEYSLALEYLHKALSLNQEVGNKEGIAINLGNIGVVHWNLSEYQRSLEYLQKAVAIYEELGKKDGIAVNFGNIGNIYVSLMEYSLALEYFQKSLAITEEIGKKDGCAMNLGNIGILYSNTNFKEYDEVISEEYLLKAIAIDEEIGAKLQLYGHRQYLAELYERQERWKEHSFHFKKYHDLEKEVQSEEAHRKSHQIEQQKQVAEREKLYEIERARSQATDEILANILPSNITERLLKGEKKIADTHENVSVLFVDIVGFTKMSAKIPAGELIDILDIVFTRFDTICKKHGLEKIKTIGDAYMAVCGAPVAVENHAGRTALAAIEMLENFSIEQKFSVPINLGFRIGLHSGSVVAGIIGENKYSYDLWGDAVNTASRMESHGEEDRIHVSEDFRTALISTTLNELPIQFIERGEIVIKGKGMMKTYFLEKTKQ
ncbi:MAG: tetratricopeptide repeat protein [Bacteroidetes bacterium]|nr:tetratricopeptide repeat protein [Bacteroidota bacterium]